MRELSPYFFVKKMTTFLVVRRPQKVMTLFQSWSPLPPHHRFSSTLSKIQPQKFHFHPGWCHPGRFVPKPFSDATVFPLSTYVEICTGFFSVEKT